MSLPEKYPPPIPLAIATYSYSDIAEGTGIVLFNAATSENVSGEQYFLTTASPYSHLVSSSGSVASQSAYEINFDTHPLNMPLVVKGRATINFSWKVTNSAGSNNNFVYSDLIKWDGSTETVLAQVSGVIIDSASGAKVTTLLKFPTVADTIIKVGEQIRVSVGVQATSNGSSPVAHLAHDPQGRNNVYFDAGNVDTTKMIAAIPFKILK